MNLGVNKKATVQRPFGKGRGGETPFSYY